MAAEELQQLPGFGKDYEANVKEAKRLLAEAGYPDGFKTVLTNRSVKLPYIDMGVYLISAWKRIGIDAEHKIEESATWSKTRRTRDFEALLDPMGTATVADPDETPGAVYHGASNNYGRFSDPVVDKLFSCKKSSAMQRSASNWPKTCRRSSSTKPYGSLACGGRVPKCAHRTFATISRCPAIG